MSFWLRVVDKHKEDSPVTSLTGTLIPTLALVALLLPGVAGAAVTDAQKCESSVEKASGKYASCLLAAESKFTKTGDATKLADAEAKCAATFEKVFTKATDKYGVDCPMVDPAQAFMDYLGTCSEGVVAGADGRSIPSGGGGGSAGALKTTGQTTPFGAGSDGAVQAGLAQSYTDNGDGTITDNVTGLMWEKKSDDDSIHDKDNRYTWGQNVSPYSMNGTMVTTFLADLNSGGGFAGYTDWRIPNVKELYSIVNLEVTNPSTFSAFNTGCTAGCTVTECSCTVPSFYWSSSTVTNPPNDAWDVDFFDGNVLFGNKNGVNYVRAVRGGL